MADFSRQHQPQLCPSVQTNYNGPVDQSTTNVNLTIYAGDPPELQQQKADQRGADYPAEIATICLKTDARLGLVGAALQEDIFGAKLDAVRATVWPPRRPKLAVKLIARKPSALCAPRFNGYSLVQRPARCSGGLCADSTWIPRRCAFYTSWGEGASRQPSHCWMYDEGGRGEPRRSFRPLGGLLHTPDTIGDANIAPSPG
ncbi:MAG: hypothetical protein R2911_21650 [Caldilineaceae bacterium]